MRHVDFEQNARRNDFETEHPKKHNGAKLILTLLVLACCIGTTEILFHPAWRNCETSSYSLKTVSALKPGGLAATTTEELNLRSAPGTEHESICTVPGNTKLTLTGKANADGTWVQAETSDGKTGWCCRPYLNLHTPDVSSELANAANPLRVKVSLHNQTVTVLDAKGMVIKTCICSSGGSGSETPTGSFTVSGRGTSFYNTELGEGAYYWTRFYGDYLFHSVPFNQYYEMKQEEASKLGTPASHGCIRLSMENAKWIYLHLPNGTSVTIQ